MCCNSEADLQNSHFEGLQGLPMCNSVVGMLVLPDRLKSLPRIDDLSISLMLLSSSRVPVEVCADVLTCENVQ